MDSRNGLTDRGVLALQRGTVGFADPTEAKISDQFERWLHGSRPRTLGGLIQLFGDKSFAVVFVVLMSVPALPLPTGGATHVLEVISMLLALELIAGRRTIWLPERWKRIDLAGRSGERFANALLRRIRWFEGFSRPRLRPLLRHRLSAVVFGAFVFALSLVAFLAPPFSGLDTLPALRPVRGHTQPRVEPLQGLRTTPERDRAVAAEGGRSVGLR